MASESSDYSASLSDLMASVAAVFLLIAGVYIFQSKRAEAAHKREAEDSRAELFTKIAKLLKIEPGHGSKAENECAVIDKSQPGRLIIRFRDPVNPSSCVGLNFNDGSDELSASQLTFVKNELSSVFRAVCEAKTIEKAPITIASLVGHTDARVSRNEIENLKKKVPFYRDDDDALLSNIPLSARRAQHVFMNVREAMHSELEILNDCLDSIFVVSGKGPTEPLVESKSDGTISKPNGSWSMGKFLPSIQKSPVDQYRENRRVELVIAFADKSKAGDEQR